MASRAGHGAGKGSQRIEVLPINELPVGLPDKRPPVDSAKAARLRGEIAAARAELASAERDDAGRVSEVTAALLGRVGGLAKALEHEVARLEAERATALSALAAELLPGMVASDPAFAAALPLAESFIAQEMADLAHDVGAGECPNGPSSMVVSAGLQLAASRVLFARGDFRLASQLANDSRQNIAAAHEYAAKRAQARAAANPRSPAERWLRPKPETAQ